jgi:hypothetical protein
MSLTVSSEKMVSSFYRALFAISAPEEESLENASCLMRYEFMLLGAEEDMRCIPLT